MIEEAVHIRAVNADIPSSSVRTSGVLKIIGRSDGMCPAERPLQ
jgi:hypothetical protein